MNKKGRTKLTEECAELIVVLAKADALESLGEHWDGKGSLKERLEEEIADVHAAMAFVAGREQLNLDKIIKRIEYKVLLFRFWDAGGKATSLPDIITYSPGKDYCHEEWFIGRKCDYKEATGDFMGHSCRPQGFWDKDQRILRQLLGNTDIVQPYSHHNTPLGFLDCTREWPHEGPCALDVV